MSLAGHLLAITNTLALIAMVIDAPSYLTDHHPGRGVALAAGALVGGAACGIGASRQPARVVRAGLSVGLSLGLLLFGLLVCVLLLGSS
jgi:hypothetical protein